MVDRYGWTALLYSARNGRYGFIKKLVDVGMDLYHKGNDGKNCLHIAALEDHLDLCKALISMHDFDVHITDNDGWNALHFAVKVGNPDLVTYFADMITNIHIKTKNGRNCLHIAALNGHFGLCKTFLDNKGFDVTPTDNENWTALHCSAQNGSLDLFSYILGKVCEIYCKTNSMKNVLHLPSQNGHYAICEFILKYFTKDFKHNNSQNKYALNGRIYMSQVFYKYSTMFLHAMDDNGNTYLHLAAKENQANICELLLKYDTDIITLLNKTDETAWRIAEDNGYKDVLNALKAECDRIGMLLFSR